MRSAVDTLAFPCIVALLAFCWWHFLSEVPDVGISDDHPMSRWLANLTPSSYVKAGSRSIEIENVWRGTLVNGSVKWPTSEWRAQFSVLPALIRPQEAEAMKTGLQDALDEFDEDRDGVDNMITYEFIIMSAGAAKATDPPRERLRRRLADITMPILHSRIAPYVRKRYPKAGAVCHSMIRRYLPNERRTHDTHWDIPSYVSVIVSLDSFGQEFDGGFYVTTGTDLHSFLPLQRGDTVVHQSDLLHGVHVRNGSRWSWAMWFQDSADCSAEAADWWKDEAEQGDPVAQTLRSMRARTADEAWSWLGSAAKSGFPRAQWYYGKAHEDGMNGQAKNAHAAAEWYRKARTGGGLDASYQLGKLERAWGNVSGAISLFKEGAEWGDFNSMVELAGAYQQGIEDLPRNLDLATHWFERAADFSPEAMYQASSLYSKATASRSSEPVKADLYLERAGRMGHFQAMQKIIGRLLHEKRFDEAVPWLLRIETRQSLEKFVHLYQSGVRLKPFSVFRAEQILHEFARQGSKPAEQMLAIVRGISPSTR